MKEAPNTMTEMDEPEARDETEREERPTRRLFGRKERTPRELRSETEWVDTLVAHEDSEPPVPSPFAATSVTEPETPEDPYPFAGLPEPEAAPQEDETYGGRYAHEWRRRQSDSLDSIHQFIDHVIGTEHDPRHRINRRAMEYGLRRNVRRQGMDVSAVRVEGLPDDLLIAFTFPEDEFRGARVVYETEGGYVVEVKRAVGGDDKRLETQYYTVSRVGEVAHVLDKMRAREAARRAEAERSVTVAPPPPRPEAPIEPLPTAPLPPQPDPERQPAREPEPEPQPEPAPEPADAPALPGPPEAPAPEAVAEQVRREHDTGAQDGEAEPTEEGRKGFGFLRRKGKDRSGDEPAGPGADDAAAAEALRRDEDAEGDEKKSRFGGIAGRFRRKGAENDDETAPET